MFWLNKDGAVVELWTLFPNFYMACMIGPTWFFPDLWLTVRTLGTTTVKKLSESWLLNKRQLTTSTW